ncbi:hypothetical protein [Halomonas salinarum]|uniref:hypothetical protein n=1 Tax=Halomonas salinarum TaxID=1158993 RepID=UPI0014387E18|nr:hypothetical protein [Halomonas salinarum]
MLQINTGKLYERGVGRKNQLTGVLYANVRLPYEREIVTAAGTLRSAGSNSGDIALVYEIEERIEKADPEPGVLVSHTVRPFLDDFAVVASFGLGGVFSRDQETVRGLTGGRPGFSSYESPDGFIAGFFDRSINISDEQADEFVAFVNELLALERQNYLGAMRAMRNFVAGLHRIPDDLALAYTLIVSSVESLAQDFDGFSPAWSDLDDRKRNTVDGALVDLSTSQADSVRAAILKSEHVALARRYRAFVKSHVNAYYFRHPAAGSHPVARYELDAALRQAYGVRSAYIHQLRSLPSPIALSHEHRETTTVERRPALTFQGLFRLTRHVIKSFVAKSPKIQKETYDYTLEQAGVVSVPMAPRYWVWRPLVNPAEARRRLEGMLSLTAAVLHRDPGAQLVDLRPMLADVERLLPQAAAVHRPALLLLHILYNLMVPPDLRTPGFDNFLSNHEAEATRPSIEAVIVSTVLNAHEEWTLEEHQVVLERYFTERTRPKGLHAPRLLEAAACLALAEKYRVAGDGSTTKLLVERAVEAHPAHVGLREFEAAYDGISVVDWQGILLPASPEAE